MRCTANSTCSVGCAPICQPSCDNPNPICPAICLDFAAHCRCNKNYVVGPKGNCILKTDCPKLKCKLHEIAVECEKACHPSCDNPSRNCTKFCLVAAKECDCAPGYVHGPSGKCIALRNCLRYDELTAALSDNETQ